MRDKHISDSACEEGMEREVEREGQREAHRVMSYRSATGPTVIRHKLVGDLLPFILELLVALRLPDQLQKETLYRP